MPNAFLRDKQDAALDTMNVLPPSSVCGMKVLDKTAFRKTVQVPVLHIPSVRISELGKCLNKKMFKVIGIKPIAEIASDNSTKLLLLDPVKCPSVDSFTDEEKTLMQKIGVDLDDWQYRDVELSYENWTHSEVLRAILPKESDGITGFSTVGHILHLNLKDDVMDFKYIIGQVLLDKVSMAKTIVNKTNIIDNTYRNFAMEVITGEPNFMTLTKENGFSYEFDFSKVYWNPRLGTEHQRIVNTLQSGDIVYDVFAGVGPFAVPAARKKCIVFANDLNPDSFKWLQHNMKLNKVKVDVHTHNLDGREFIRDVMKPDLLQRWRTTEGDMSYAIHIVMNLPALAVEFLDAFCGLMTGVEKSCMEIVRLPTVHCYCFSKSEDPCRDARERVEGVLGTRLEEGKHSVRTVRNVAPNKEMLCVMFTLTEDILFDTLSKDIVTEDVEKESSEVSDLEEQPPPEKKAKQEL